MHVCLHCIFMTTCTWEFDNLHHPCGFLFGSGTHIVSTSFNGYIWFVITAIDKKVYIFWKANVRWIQPYVWILGKMYNILEKIEKKPDIFLNHFLNFIYSNFKDKANRRIPIVWLWIFIHALLLYLLSKLRQQNNLFWTL